MLMLGNYSLYFRGFDIVFDSVLLLRVWGRGIFSANIWG